MLRGNRLTQNLAGGWEHRFHVVQAGGNLVGGTLVFMDEQAAIPIGEMFTHGDFILRHGEIVRLAIGEATEIDCGGGDVVGGRLLLE